MCHYIRNIHPDSKFHYHPGINIRSGPLSRCHGYVQLTALEISKARDDAMVTLCSSTFECRIIAYHRNRICPGINIIKEKDHRGYDSRSLSIPSPSIYPSSRDPPNQRQPLENIIILLCPFEPFAMPHSGVFVHLIRISVPGYGQR